MSCFPMTSMPDSDWWTALWPNPDKNIMDIIDPQVSKSMKALDICCGDGLFTLSLCKQFQFVAGIELDENLVELAKKACNTHDYHNHNLVVGDAMKLSEIFPEKYDFILIANTFHGIPDQSMMIESVKSVLSTNGKFVIINWYKRPREETTVLEKPRGPPTTSRMSVEDTTLLLTSHGFTLERVVDVSPYHYAAIYNL